MRGTVQIGRSQIVSRLVGYQLRTRRAHRRRQTTRDGDLCEFYWHSE